MVWHAIKRTSAGSDPGFKTRSFKCKKCVCVLVLGAFVLMILSEMSSSSKRNNLDLYDPIGGLSEHGGLREPPETHLDLPLSSTMTSCC